MNKEEIKHFKALLRQGALRHMNILLDDKFQKELLNIIKDYEKLQQENQALKNSLTLLEKNIIQLNDKQRDLYKSVIDEIRDVIEKMIHIGYTSKEHLTSYFATSEKSEFGCRAKLLLEILDKAKEIDN